MKPRFVVFALSGIGALALSGEAAAATFDVHLCADSAVTAPVASEAVGHSSHPISLSVTSSCRANPAAQFDGLAAVDVTDAPNAPRGAIANWIVNAVTGTTIVSARLRRYLGKRSNSWDVWTRTGSGVTLDTCEISSALSCTVGALPTDPAALETYNGLDTTSLSWGISCRASIGECTTGTSLRSAWAIVYGATFTVSDPDPPQLSPLAGGLADGRRWRTGTEQAEINASDASGIKRLELLVDSGVVSAANQSCSYDRMRPCPRDAQLTTAVDLTRLVDGAHTAAVRATDAAGQTSTAAPTPFSIDNHAPGAPIGLGFRHRADGAIDVAWGNPEQGAGAPIMAAHYQFCPIGSSTACVGSGIVSADHVSSLEGVRPPAGRSPWDLLVWLQDEAGHVDRAAAARVLVEPVPTQAPSGGRPPGSGPPRAPRAQPGNLGLRVRSVVRRRGKVRVVGTLDRRFSGRITVAVRSTAKGAPLARRTVRVRRGRFVAELEIGRRTLRPSWIVTAHFRGSALYKKTTVVQRVRQIQGGGSR
ncbi:hypothetical protein VSS74_01650 [Conexibacter stalactiti]|uniref:Ig-like domain-containing protein n=1 Tax=Conexibacter stalactiti TaxID=1940611 RepID=A0ABU4HI86_9ACTN|nr:hypothetical protein [Conexibacter stalactiti]MDW5593023.1 hypothetical protein [Conexibacter stalactiti]MEC5033664.1 hypothetical protein [Conexibacter stalactiti]